MTNEISVRLVRLNRLIHRNIISRKLFCADSDRSGRCDNITMANSCIIDYLFENSDADICQRDLEEQLGMRRSTLSKELSLLEQKGFIKRESLSHDKRLRKIVLCDKVLPIAKKIKGDRHYLQQIMTAGISDAELDNFYKTLQKITENLMEDSI